MNKKASIAFVLLTILWTGFIFSQSLMPASQSSTESGRIVDFILRFIDIDKSLLTVIVRKAAHIFEFFVQSTLLGFSLLFLQKFPKNITLILFLGLLTACCDEFLQLFSDGRGGLVSDIFIDFSGTITGVVFGLVLYKMFFKSTKD